MLLDLRGAAWGAPADGAKVAEIFLQGGPVAKLVGRRAEEQLLQADAARSAWSGPLAVLVDNGTAGPGEIVAAALLDAGRAKLVGEHTFGRASVSKTVALPEGGLVLTVAKYVSPKGTSIHGEGLAPSVPVAAEREEDEDLPEGAPKPDRILEKALEVVKARRAGREGRGLTSQPSAHERLQALPRREAGPAPTGHPHGLARVRVVGGARLAAAHEKRPEVHELDRLALLERPGDLVEDPVQGAQDVGLREAGVPRDPGHELGLVQVPSYGRTSSGASWTSSFFASLSVTFSWTTYFPGS